MGGSQSEEERMGRMNLTCHASLCIVQGYELHPRFINPSMHIKKFNPSGAELEDQVT